MAADTYKTKGMRQVLINSLREKGITHERVLEAMNKVPRHLFLDSAFLSYAYQDKAFNIGEGQTISQPYTVAYQSSLLDVQIGEKVLEIGTGSGYQASVLIEMGANLYTIEYNRKLYEKAKHLLQKLKYKGNFIYGDGSQGFTPSAPYHKILVTAGAPTVPHTLIEQLAEGGRLVIPVGNLQSQQMYCIDKLPNGKIKETALDFFVFVPLLGKYGWDK
ncbi:MAG: protein-L-isoaspartate(D-aspartate) O-methyltransferase [Thermoflexibacter sp.]